MNKILIVEDEVSIRSFLRINFQRENFHVIEAETGEEGIREAKLEKPNIVILDVMLPKLNGFEVCRILREEFPGLGIIMLTAKTQDMDKIMGLEFGADDYVTKPFNPSELILRTKALLRRMDSKEEKCEEIITSGPFKIDTYAQNVYKNDLEIDVTPKEYMLMKIFLQNEGKAFSRDELLDLIWGYNFVGDSKIVDVNIRRLRAKIEDEPSNPIYIQTVWGKGYRWKSFN